MKKRLPSVVAHASTAQITVGAALFLAVVTGAIYYASGSSEYGRTIDAFPTMAVNPAPEAVDLSTHIASDAGLNAPTGAVVTQTSPEEIPASTAGDGAPLTVSNTGDPAQPAARLREAAAAAQIATQTSYAGGYSGIATTHDARSSSVGGAGGSGAPGGGAAGSVGGGNAGSGGTAGAASHRTATNETPADHKTPAAPPGAGNVGHALSDASNVHVAPVTDGPPNTVPVTQDPITAPSAPAGPRALDGSDGSNTTMIPGNSSTDDFGLATSSTNVGTNTSLAGPPLADQALGLATDPARDGMKLANVASAPDAGGTLLFFSFGITTLLAFSRRYSFRFIGPSAWA